MTSAIQRSTSCEWQGYGVKVRGAPTASREGAVIELHRQRGLSDRFVPLNELSEGRSTKVDFFVAQTATVLQKRLARAIAKIWFTACSRTPVTSSTCSWWAQNPLL